MMQILVTGVAGFIGSHAATRLLKDGHDVIGLDSLDPYYSMAQKQNNLSLLKKSKRFSFLQTDIRHRGLSDIFEQYRPEVVLHLAAKAGVRASLEDPVSYFSTNVSGTLNILEQAKKFGVKKVMAASSSSVYGSNTKVPFSESDAVDNQVSPYAASKRAMEVMAKNYSLTYHLPIQLFRFFTVYGPSGRPDMAPYIFSKKILSGETVTVFDGLDNERDFTYIDDIIEGMMGALKVEEDFAIYNLGNNRPEPLSALIAAIEKATKMKSRVKIEEKRQGDVKRTWADIRLAQEKFGYQPKTSLDQGIKKFVAWLKHSAEN